MVSIKLFVPLGSNGSFKCLLPLPRSITAISTERNFIKSLLTSALLNTEESLSVTNSDRSFAINQRESVVFDESKILSIIYAASTSLRVFPEYHLLGYSWLVC